MKSKVHMEVDPAGKISKVQDKWNGKLPDNTILNVAPKLPLTKFFRRANAVTMPSLIGVPKTAADETK
jgi:hypothetical protein